MLDDHQVPATRADMKALVAEYEQKREAIPDAIEALKDAQGDLVVGTTLRGQYAGNIWGRYGSAGVPSVSDCEKNLLQSSWHAAWKAAKLDELAPANDREQFRVQMETPPEFTIENVFATFERYLGNPRATILRGLAEAFTGLDPFFKSHSKVKIGVKGLPKRIIMSNVTDHWSHGAERLRDVLNALRVYEGRPHLAPGELDDLLAYSKMFGLAPEWRPNQRYSSGSKVMHINHLWRCEGGQYDKSEFNLLSKEGGNGWRRIKNPEPGLQIKLFGNGNAHVHFDKDTLINVNRGLAEFYGDVLPDCEDEEVTARRPSTEVAPKLQFYRTPREVIDRMMRDIDFRFEKKVLEPSCGDGAILDVVRERARQWDALGVEFNTERAMETRAKGHVVFCGNFLRLNPKPEFDFVFMNPPFYRTHWRKHIDHARKFLKPGDPNVRYGHTGAGRLIAVLPASAYYDGHLDDLNGTWEDLPVASFAESGTNVPTGIWKMWG